MPFKTSTGHTQANYIEHITETANMNHIGNTVELRIAIAVFYQKFLTFVLHYVAYFLLLC